MIVIMLIVVLVNSVCSRTVDYLTICEKESKIHRCPNELVVNRAISFYGKFSNNKCGSGTSNNDKGFVVDFCFMNSNIVHNTQCLYEKNCTITFDSTLKSRYCSSTKNQYLVVEIVCDEMPHTYYMTNAVIEENTVSFLTCKLNEAMIIKSAIYKEKGNGGKCTEKSTTIDIPNCNFKSGCEIDLKNYIYEKDCMNNKSLEVKFVCFMKKSASDALRIKLEKGSVTTVGPAERKFNLLQLVNTDYISSNILTPLTQILLSKVKNDSSDSSMVQPENNKDQEDLVCRGDTYTAKCPNNKRISMTGYLISVPSGDTCDYFDILNTTTCDRPMRPVDSSLCGGENSCTINIKKLIEADKCSDKNKIFYIYYKCVEQGDLNHSRGVTKTSTSTTSTTVAPVDMEPIITFAKELRSTITSLVLAQVKKSVNNGLSRMSNMIQYYVDGATSRFHRLASA